MNSLAKLPRYLVLIVVILTTTLAGSASMAAGPSVEQTKLLAFDGAAHDRFGDSVVIDGETLVVGAPGSAYVFTRSGGVWTQQAKLTASDGATLLSFRGFMAIDGETLVVGALDELGEISGSGSAYVFTRSGGVWTQQAKLTASDGAAGDFFGWSVAIDGETLVVGARRDDDLGENSGSAYVFTRSGGVWTQQAKLTASDGAAYDRFGFSVAIHGETLVVGAPESAYVFTRSGGVWTQQAKLTASDGATFHSFYGSMAIDGETLVVGAPQDDTDLGEDSGSAYIFTRLGGVWTQQAKLTASDGATFDSFGSSVAIHGDTLVVGTPWDDDLGENSGSAYVFTRLDGVWTQQAKLTASDGAAIDAFGLSVAIDGKTLVVGAPWDDDLGETSGSAYVYVYEPPNQPPSAEAGGPYGGNEGAAIPLSGAHASDPDGDPLALGWSVDSARCSFSDTSALNPDLICDDNGGFSVTLTVSDGVNDPVSSSATVTINNLAPTVGAILITPDPPVIAVGTAIHATASFNDPGTADTHSALWDWGDDGSSTGSVDQGANAVADSHTYDTPGIYPVKLTVTDDDLASGDSSYEFVVVYDPDGGFVTGGGWISSPPGACQFSWCDDNTTGRANFGFVSKYQKGADAPTGNTEFQFKAGNLNFHSDSYDWLVVAGARAKYKGTGDINGSGHYGFMLTAIDADLTSSINMDRFRIKIWEKDTDMVVYDNQMGATDDAELDPASTAIGGGNIKIHKEK